MAAKASPVARKTTKRRPMPHAMRVFLADKRNRESSWTNDDREWWEIARDRERRRLA